MLDGLYRTSKWPENIVSPVVIRGKSIGDVNGSLGTGDPDKDSIGSRTPIRIRHQDGVSRWIIRCANGSSTVRAAKKIRRRPVPGYNIVTGIGHQLDITAGRNTDD